MKTTAQIVLTALMLVIVSCSTPGVKLRTKPVANTSSLADILTPGGLSPEARAYLRAHGLDGEYRKNTDKTISSLRSDLAKNPSVEGSLTLIEICKAIATRIEKKNPHRAVGYHLAAAETAFATNLSSSSPEFLNAYNTSTEEIIRILFDPETPWDQKTAFTGPGKTFHLRLQGTGSGNIAPNYYDVLFPASYMEFKDISLKRNLVSGLGAALVGHRKGTPDRVLTDPFLAPEGLSMPVNATLDFSGGGSIVKLAFHDLTSTSTTRLAGRRVPLAADFTAPLAVLYNYVPKHNIGWAGMLHPEEYADRMGLFQLEPYRSDRIPLVFVHGLMSSPETWFATLNLLNADPRLRQRYQVLVYYYPTGFPIVYNSASLRQFLKDYQEKYDPGRSNPKMRKMIMVGHSMGGLLTSGQVRNSGDVLSSEFFTKPINEINGLTERQKDTLETLLVYQANPDISRAIFVAAPHRGSDLAVKSIGQLGNALIHVPLNLFSTVPIPVVDGMTDLGRETVSSRPNGINNLDPREPSLMAVLREPVRRGTTYHSIIGKHNPKDSLEDSSDTVVPYWSSHLNRAASEKVVHAMHTTITRNEQSNEEIRRILYLHAGMHYSP